jgi:hypothetical protein
VAWGSAIQRLEKGVGGLVARRCVPQRQGAESLKLLVDKKAVESFIQYCEEAQPNLDSKSGAEVDSVLAFQADCKVADYKGVLPIRNFHRFEKAALDKLVGNHKTPGELPLAIMLISAFDHGRAYHRDAKITEFIRRENVRTLVVEGATSLSGLLETALALADKYGKKGKIDELVIGGHGAPSKMELTGANDFGESATSGKAMYGRRTQEALEVDGKSGEWTPESEKLVRALLGRMADDGRVVLKACLVGANQVTGPLSDNPEEAQQQIQEEIRRHPSLLTKLQATAEEMNFKGLVLGSNASTRDPGLVDKQGRANLTSDNDEHLTAPKDVYAEKGKEPEGVMRAIVETWGSDRKKCWTALETRLSQNPEADWNAFVIHALCQLVHDHFDEAQTILELSRAAQPLTHLGVPYLCAPGEIAGKLPAKLAKPIYDLLFASAGIKWGAHAFLAILQAYPEVDSAEMLVTLTMAMVKWDQLCLGRNRQILDLSRLDGNVEALMGGELSLGQLMIALAFVEARGKAAPPACLKLLSLQLDEDKRFKAELKKPLTGGNERALLMALGVIETADESGEKTANVDTQHSGINDFFVEARTLVGVTFGITKTKVYEKPGEDAKVVEEVSAGTTLDIIGAPVPTTKGKLFGGTSSQSWWAVELPGKHGKFTGFVRAEHLKKVG